MKEQLQKEYDELMKRMKDEDCVKLKMEECHISQEQ